MPGASRLEQLEALSQEFLAAFPTDPDEDDAAIREACRPIGAVDAGEAREAALEAETERWAALPEVGAWPAPDVRFYETATARGVDARLRELASLRARWDDLVGYCAHAIKRTRLHLRLGFADFRHYCEQRLGLPPRTVEQRAKLEERLWASPALREARRQKLSYEKLRLLATLPEHEIGAWTPRAHALTCIALRRALEGEKERQMRAAGSLSAALPRRVGALLAAAIQAVRSRAGEVLGAGKCLAVIAWHFLETWGGLAKRKKSRSQQVRERDDGRCQVPGCSHHGAHSHHVNFRSHGGGDEPENQVAVCGFHHLRCIHGGYLRVTGRAPDGLTWWLAGKPWTGAPSPRPAYAQLPDRQDLAPVDLVQDLGGGEVNRGEAGGDPLEPRDPGERRVPRHVGDAEQDEEDREQEEHRHERDVRAERAEEEDEREEAPDEQVRRHRDVIRLLGEPHLRQHHERDERQPEEAVGRERDRPERVLLLPLHEAGEDLREPAEADCPCRGSSRARG